MKCNKHVLHLLIILSISSFISAKENSVRYIPEKPQPGEKVTVIFDASGTALAGAKNIEMVVSLYSRKTEDKSHFEDTYSVIMKKNENSWQANVQTSPITEIVAVKFMHENINENNNGAGYFIRTFDRNGIETPGSILGYAAAINFWATVSNFADRNTANALAIFQKNFLERPELKAKYLVDYIGLLYMEIPKDEREILIGTELKEIEKFGELTDEDYFHISRYYGLIKMNDKLAEVDKTAIKKFPKGETAAYKYSKEVEAEKDLEKQKKLALQFEKEFPGNYQQVYIPPFAIVFRNMILAKKMDMAAEWIKYIEENYKSKNEKMYGWYIWAFINAKCESDFAFEIASRADKYFTDQFNSRDIKDKPKSSTEKNWLLSKKETRSRSAARYAQFLHMFNKKEEALKKYEQAFSLQPFNKFDEKDQINYINLLMEFEKHESAGPCIEEMVKLGIHVGEMETALKRIYLTKDKTEVGFDAYFKELYEPYRLERAEKIKKKIITEQAPQFTLTNLDGKNVALSDFKGKVVIVDFWATWCGPCLASFPSMQKIVNKFKDSQNVVFLFINTWQKEANEDKKKNAENFIKKNMYTFNVLLDIEDKVVADFKVKGIPTKYIIDGSGNIRFNVVGFEGSDDTAVEELSTMIELASK